MPSFMDNATVTNSIATARNKGKQGALQRRMKTMKAAAKTSGKPAAKKLTGVAGNSSMAVDPKGATQKILDERRKNVSIKTDDPKGLTMELLKRRKQQAGVEE